jgi:hypothetical protein
VNRKQQRRITIIFWMAIFLFTVLVIFGLTCSCGQQSTAVISKGKGGWYCHKLVGETWLNTPVCYPEKTDCLDRVDFWEQNEEETGEKLVENHCFSSQKVFCVKVITDYQKKTDFCLTSFKECQRERLELQENDYYKYVGTCRQVR